MILEKSKIQVKISAFELDFHKLLQFGGRVVYKQVPEFPSVERDLALVVDDKVNYADLFEEIKNFSPLIVAVEGFDLYLMPDDRKSLAFHLVFQSPNRTLKSEEADEIQEQIIERLNKKFKAQLRK
jgi:phenylalanyl-tRNA synthetase beta chain